MAQKWIAENAVSLDELDAVVVRVPNTGGLATRSGTYQVEVSKTDARTLGVEAVIAQSGKHDGTPGIDIVGPCGRISLEKGCIVAKRHVHMVTVELRN